jgi:hypothetical protein
MSENRMVEGWALSIPKMVMLPVALMTMWQQF